MRICVVSTNYPMYGRTAYGAFVHNIVQAWERAGIKLDVIAPLSPSRALTRGMGLIESTMLGGRSWSEPRASRPVYASFSQLTNVNSLFGRLSRWSLVRVAALSASRFGEEVDVYYGKFLTSGALAAGYLAEGKPALAVGDLGESRLSVPIECYGASHVKQILGRLDGVVCVSSRIGRQVVEIGMPKGRVLVAPNAPDLNVFTVGSRWEAREQLGLPLEEFLVGFVGHFSPRKGPARVVDAIGTIPGCRGVFLGAGKQVPRGGSVAYAGAVSHAEVPRWLQACDLFVLPTRAEGSCNAIWEAMACGLPVVSSDIPEVREQVPENGGILVDAESVEELREAIVCLMRDEERRRKMGAVARDWVETKGGIRERSMRILEFISGLQHARPTI